MDKAAKMRERYEDMAEDQQKALDCTCSDETIRGKEVAAICSFIEHTATGDVILDLGCANGYTIDTLQAKYPGRTYWGIDATKKMIDNARSRALPDCIFSVGDARNLEFEDAYFNAIYTQRCLINIPTWEGQKSALHSIHRVLKPRGCYLMIECFMDGLENNNKAREECGLDPLPPAEVNNYFDKDLFHATINGMFEMRQFTGFPPNFLSSHYFISRVLHALITKGEQIRNTEFVKFFSHLPPIGNYSPLQCHALVKV